MQAATQEERATILTNGIASKQPVEPLSSYTVGRIRREFANQSSIGLMVTSVKRQLGDSLRFLPDSAYTSGVDWDLRFKKRYSVTGYLVGSRLHGEPEAISRIQENSRHYFQRPDSASTELDPTRTVLTGGAGDDRHQQDRRRTRSFQLERVVQVSGLRHQRHRVPAPGRPAVDRQLAAVPQREAESLAPEPLHQLQRVRRLEFRRRQAVQRRQRQRNFNFINNWSAGGGGNYNARCLDDRATRGGPGVYIEGYKVSGPGSTPTTASRSR